MMKKIIGLFLSIAIGISMIIDGYIVFFNGPRHLSTKRADESASSSTKKTAPAKSKTGQYLNGIYTGRSVSTEWGHVQVRATIQNGKLTYVSVLKSPNSEDYSRRLNKRVLPTYESEAVKAQSANITHVSGATVTYKGFKASLQNALNQAKRSNESQNQQAN
ncbi:FMN-binding protein [Lentilactobacillus otakiensis]|nr:FMN-binding protein [Lentilactobacillus otakiensis]